MASFAKGLFKHFARRNCNRQNVFVKVNPIFMSNIRSNHMFRYLGNVKEHETPYLFERTQDPKEWEFVERLMPFETVPVPAKKANYPSGWRPASDEGLKHPYFVERTKNHMLPVYLRCYNRGQRKVTELKRIHGDFWLLYEELKNHLEEQVGKKLASSVIEGNTKINFRGDYVYYIEQWLLKKGF